MPWEIPVSLSVNISKLWTWRRSIVGYWTGNSQQDGKPDVNYELKLVLTTAMNGALEGLLVYQGVANRKEIVCRGVDQLMDGADDALDVQRGIWRPKFVRKAHERASEFEYEPHPPEYAWGCRVTNWRRNSIMDFEVTNLDDPRRLTFRGKCYRR